MGAGSREQAPGDPSDRRDRGCRTLEISPDARRVQLQATGAR